MNQHPDPKRFSKPQMAQQRSTGAGSKDALDRLPVTTLVTEPVLVQPKEFQFNSVSEKLQRHRNPLASFLTSLLAHTILILTLLLLMYSLPQPAPRISVIASIEPNKLPEEPADENPNTTRIELPDVSESPIENNAEDIATENETLLAQSPNAIINSIAIENNAPSVTKNIAPAQPVLTLPTGGGLAGREANARGKLAAERGGSAASESAVENGLRWILAHQRDDGSWRFHHDDGQCNGDCLNEGTRESTTAATGLALLALLGAGYTHQSGPHQEAVQRGLDYLQSKIRYTAHGGILAEGKDGMYAQAIATMALAEAFSMTKDSSLIHAVVEARDYIIAAQHRGGSWGYNAGSPGDTTLTGWQLMALKSCQRAGFGTKPETWDAAERFIDSMGASESTYGYKSPKEFTQATTAVGLLAKMYLGLPKEHGLLANGGELLAGYGPSKNDVYFNYYATQVLHHLGGDDWKTWNESMRDWLIATQATNAGHADGSWYFDDQHGLVGGRLYTTAMAVMILEVYYRYLPLYDESILD